MDTRVQLKPVEYQVVRIYNLELACDELSKYLMQRIFLKHSHADNLRNPAQALVCSVDPFQAGEQEDIGPHICVRIAGSSGVIARFRSRGAHRKAA